MPRDPGDFGVAFTALLRAAGTNPDGVLRALPGVTARSVLYDWKNGEHLPGESGPLVRVVEFCLERAGAAADLGSAPGDVSGWLGLLAEAKQTRDTEADRRRAPSRTDREIGADPQARDGWPVERWGPVRLGVHQAIGGGPLPTYVHRAHDHLLYALLNPDVAANRLVVLRGGSSTGKSRAAYETVRTRSPRVPVLYPRTAEALGALLERPIAGRSVLWLNELRDYADDPGGQAALAKLADLLLGRDHLVVITSAWPEYWAAYTASHHAGPGTGDPVRAVRALLAPLPEVRGMSPRDVDAASGGVVDVPAVFAGEDLVRARRHGGSLVREAIVAAERAGSPGQVAQYLAGVPALLNHYQGPGADPYARALITAAMDAVRLGHYRWLTREFLQEAAVGYLTGQQRALPTTEWQRTLTRAWEYATRTLHGAIRALRPIPPAQGVGVAGYRLADYLHQTGRTLRKDQVPPPSLWAAATAHAHPADLKALGNAAWELGRYRESVQLHKNAVTQGEADAAWDLVGHLHTLHPADHRPAHWAATSIALDDPHEVGGLLLRLLDVRASEQVAELVARDPAGHAAVNDLDAVEVLLIGLREAGADEQVAVLAERAAAHGALGDPGGVAALLRWLLKDGPREQVSVLLARTPAARVTLDRPYDVAALLVRLREAGADDQVATLAKRALTHITTKIPGGMASLLDSLRKAGADEHVAALAERAAAQVAIVGGLERLLKSLRDAGEEEQIAVLAERAVAHVAIDNPSQVNNLLGWLLDARAGVSALLARDPARHVNVDDYYRVGELLQGLRKAHAHEQVTVLAERAVAHVAIDTPHDVAGLLGGLLKAKADEQVEALLARDPATHVTLDKATGVGRLLENLRKAGANEQLRVLLARDPATHVTLDDPFGVDSLLMGLREVGAHDQVRVLLARDPATHVTLDLFFATRLVRTLREVGAQQQASALDQRLSTCGRYHAGYGDPSVPLSKKRDQATSAASWSWDDLE